MALKLGESKTGQSGVVSLSSNPTTTNSSAQNQTATPVPEATPETTAATPATTQRQNVGTSYSFNSTSASGAAGGYTPTGMYDPANLDAFNKQRETDIRNLYAAAQDNSLASLKTAYDQNLSDAEAARGKITPRYQQSMNSLAAEYERQRRNNNMQATANGLNTGAGSQMQLSQSANYQRNQAGLAQKENEALDEADRAIDNLKRNYQNAIAEATANNNYKLAAALMEEYQNAYNRQLQIENTNYTRAWNEDERAYTRSAEEAARKAQYGDFSGYRDLYGDETGSLMEKMWATQNPQLAAAAGIDVSGSGTGGSGSSSSSSKKGDVLRISDGSIVRIEPGGKLSVLYNSPYRGGGRGYSASRDTAYRGAPGYLNDQGQFVNGWSNDTAAPDHEQDADYAHAYANAYDQYYSNSNNDNGAIDRRGLT